ncbi:outer membrane efflux protein [Chitinophaga polysaccharea]|uniref:Outer membrane efflux protein n=1 Tax=Chitinophaga polysaccharea TaxID=1293035 RepID=A0A561PWG1_9BACT|nr:TolC family protein [Chitinophaga polysaccharea]TWF42435.1 outer membrane efflux protein [Chitinophaga polysaccharea]
MKRVLLFLLVAFTGTIAKAQQADTAVLLRLPADQPTVARLKERLVELAYQNPQLKEIDFKKQISKYEENKAKASWLDMLTAAGNLNEFTIKGSGTTNNNTLYPRYNFGVMVPIGHLISIPNDVKIAKANGKALEQQKETGKLALKAAVLRAYEDYAANKQLYELQLPLLEDAYNHYKQVESRFSKADQNTQVETLNEAYRLYNAEMVRKVALERDVKQSKIALEGIIGSTMEEVLLHL